MVSLSEPTGHRLTPAAQRRDDPAECRGRSCDLGERPKSEGARDERTRTLLPISRGNSRALRRQVLDALPWIAGTGRGATGRGPRHCATTSPRLRSKGLTAMYGWTIAGQHGHAGAAFPARNGSSGLDSCGTGGGAAPTGSAWDGRMGKCGRAPGRAATVVQKAAGAAGGMTRPGLIAW